MTPEQGVPIELHSFYNLQLGDTIEANSNISAILISHGVTGDFVYAGSKAENSDYGSHIEHERLRYAYEKHTGEKISDGQIRGFVAEVRNGAVVRISQGSHTFGHDIHNEAMREFLRYAEEELELDIDPGLRQWFS